MNKSRVLIISTNAIGDTFLSASAIKPLRAILKETEIHFLSDINSRFLLDHIEVERRYYVTQRKLFSLVAVYKNIFREKFDFVFLFFPGYVNTFFFFAAKGVSKFGFPNILPMKEWHDKKQHLFIKGSKAKTFEWFSENPYLERINLALLRLGIIDSPIEKPRFKGLDEPNTEFEEKIVLHFRSRSPAKSLRVKTVIEIIHDLSSLVKNDVVLIGTKNDFNDFPHREISCRNYEILVGLDLKELLGLILGCRLFIGIDSFPLHLADAYNSNFVGIFGPTNPFSALSNPKKSIQFKEKELKKVSANQILEELKQFL